MVKYMTNTNLTKYCKSCDTTKPIEMFTKLNRKSFTKGNIKRNYLPKDGYHSYCKECNAKRAREFRLKYKEATGNSDYRGTGKIKDYPSEDRRLISAIRHRISTAKRNNKRTDRPFNLEVDYMYKLWKKQKGLCALTGFPMSLDGDTNIRLSIDKIVPKLGYNEGNVQWTIFSANRAKGDLTEQDFLKLCRMVIERATTIENTANAGSE